MNKGYVMKLPFVGIQKVVNRIRKSRDGREKEVLHIAV